MAYSFADVRLSEGVDPEVGPDVSLEAMLAKIQSVGAAQGPLLPRAWSTLNSGNASRDAPQLRFMNFNVLAEGLSAGGEALVPPFCVDVDGTPAKASSYGGFDQVDAPETCLDFHGVRKWRILEEVSGARTGILCAAVLHTRTLLRVSHPIIRDWRVARAPHAQILRVDPDVLAVEECDHFSDFFLPALAKLGFHGVFAPKQGSPSCAFGFFSDGVALFWKSTKLALRTAEGAEGAAGGDAAPLVTLLQKPSAHCVVALQLQNGIMPAKAAGGTADGAQTGPAGAGAVTGSGAVAVTLVVAATHLKAKGGAANEEKRRAQVAAVLAAVDRTTAAAAGAVAVGGGSAGGGSESGSGGGHVIGAVLLGDFNTDAYEDECACKAAAAAAAPAAAAFASQSQSSSSMASFDGLGSFEVVSEHASPVAKRGPPWSGEKAGDATLATKRAKPGVPPLAVPEVVAWRSARAGGGSGGGGSGDGGPSSGAPALQLVSAYPLEARAGSVGDGGRWSTWKVRGAYDARHTIDYCFLSRPAPPSDAPASAPTSASPPSASSALSASSASPSALPLPALPPSGGSGGGAPALALVPVALLEPPPDAALPPGRLPCAAYPSDHLSIAADVLLCIVDHHA